MTLIKSEVIGGSQRNLPQKIGRLNMLKKPAAKNKELGHGGAEKPVKDRGTEHGGETRNRHKNYGS
ncbi:hypothetical protein D3C76_1545130 [compost metagenome]